jgi:hypothetical protein
MRYQVSHPYKTTGKIIVLCILIFVYFWIVNWKTMPIGKMEIRYKVTILGAFVCNNSFELIEHHD